MTCTKPLFTALAACTALFCLPGCEPGENDPGPGGVTVGEAQALDDAAAMLEAQKLPADALDNPPSAPQEGAQQTPE